MTDRATILEVTNFGVEITPGTAVAANRRMQALSVGPGIQAEMASFRPMGGKYPTIAALGKEWVEADIAGDIACYNHLTYLLCSVLAFDAPAQQAATTAWRWTLTPAQSATDAIRTYTVECGSGVRAGRFAHGIVTGLNLSFSRDAIGVSGAMLGRAYEDGVTLTASPTLITPMPILPTTLDIFLDPTSAAIGTTRLTRAISGALEIGDRFSPVWAINSQVLGFAATVETAPTAQLRLLLQADAAGMALLPAMRAGARRYIRLRAVGPLIESTFFYTLQIDLCGTVREVGSFSDEDGIYAIEWTFDLTFDSAWAGGRIIEVQLTNIVAAL